MNKVSNLTIEVTEDKKISFTDEGDFLDIKISDSSNIVNLPITKNQLDLIYKYFHQEDITKEDKDGAND